MKFKIGDKVRIINVLGSSEKKKYIGNVWTVSNTDRGMQYPYTLKEDVDERFLWSAGELEFAIKYIDQICSECKKPCPHENPNQPDKSYICKSCIIMNDLSTL
jgi:hypothetical protein